MKKVLSVLLAVIMMISLFAGCGGSSPAPDTSAPAEAVPSDEGSEAPASGDRIKIGIDANRLHFFDVDTEATILNR